MCRNMALYSYYSTCNIAVQSDVQKHTFINLCTNLKMTLCFVEAFQRAKQRMIAAREGLKKEFIETLKAYDTVDDSD